MQGGVVHFCKSFQAGKETLKLWACMCTLWLFIHSLLYNFYFPGVLFCFVFLSVSSILSFLMQLAVDLEVLRVIARTRMEIRAIRSKYTATKAERESLPLGNTIVDTWHKHCTIHTMH